MADIFLSYNEGDRDTARRLAQALASAGWSVWWDRRIPAGVTWRSMIERELQAMRCMVVVWSSRSVQSEWVCEEAAEGRQAHKLVPVMIEAVRPPAGFRELQAADLIGWDGAADFPGLRQLIEDIGRLLRPSLSDSPAHPPAEHQPRPVLEPASEDRRPPPGPAVPDNPDRRHRWLWMFAGVALLAAIGIGFYAGKWPEAQDIPAPGATKPVASEKPSIETGAATSATVAPVAPTTTITPMRPSTPTTASATATSAASKPTETVAVTIKKPAAPKPRCAALLERQQLGETLPASARLFLQQEC